MASQLTDDYRRTSYEISQAIAPDWEHWRSRFEAAVAPVREWMVRELASRPGATILELAAGAGDTGFQAAGALGDDGHLISTDFSPAMLDVGRRRGAELGIGNVEFRVMDAEHLELDTDSVDGVLCRFGYMLMADPAAALSETRRVLRPGGRLALGVWGAPERNPFFTLIVSTLVKGGHVPPPREAGPNPFSMASPDHTKALLQAAGFGAVKVDEAPVEFRFRDVDDYFGFMADTAGPLAIALRKLPEQDRKTVVATLENSLGVFETDGEYKIPGVALVAAAS
jgi:SAM-dependent methyltransferase